jgi:hypothetical protein
MFHYTIAEMRKLADENKTNQSVIKPGPSLTVQVGPSWASMATQRISVPTFGR